MTAARKLAWLRVSDASGGPSDVFGAMSADGSGSAVNPDNKNMQPGAAGITRMFSIDASGDRIAWPHSYFD